MALSLAMVKYNSPKISYKLHIPKFFELCILRFKYIFTKNGSLGSDPNW